MNAPFLSRPTSLYIHRVQRTQASDEFGETPETFMTDDDPVMVSIYNEVSKDIRESQGIADTDKYTIKTYLDKGIKKGDMLGETEDDKMFQVDSVRSFLCGQVLVVKRIG
jgi:hypothetical protein